MKIYRIWKGLKLNGKKIFDLAQLYFPVLYMQKH